MGNKRSGLAYTGRGSTIEGACADLEEQLKKNTSIVMLASKLVNPWKSILSTINAHFVFQKPSCKCYFVDIYSIFDPI